MSTLTNRSQSQDGKHSIGSGSVTNVRTPRLAPARDTEATTHPKTKLQPTPTRQNGVANCNSGRLTRQDYTCTPALAATPAPEEEPTPAPWQTPKYVHSDDTTKWLATPRTAAPPNRHDMQRLHQHLRHQVLHQLYPFRRYISCQPAAYSHHYTRASTCRVQPAHCQSALGVRRPCPSAVFAHGIANTTNTTDTDPLQLGAPLCPLSVIQLFPNG